MQIRAAYRRVKAFVKECFLIITTYKDRLKEIETFPSGSMIVWGIPEHGNLGDQAITYAEVSFIKKNCPGRSIFLIPERKCIEYIYPMRRSAADKRFIFISHGGGNMGTLYRYQEKCRQLLIKNIRSSKIVVFPQSTDYVLGTKDHRKANKIYQQNKGLYLFARDEINYSKMKSLFPRCRVGLVPDIVTTVRINEIEMTQRERVLCLLRSDREVNRGSKGKIEDLLNYIGREKCSFSDTYKQEFSCRFEDQGKQIEHFWLDVRRSKLVVTDRLHGMIFSMINHIPCIAFDNSTGKVTAFYKTWFDDCDSIKICDGVNDDIKYFVDRCISGDADNEYYIELDEKFAALRESLMG